MDLSHIRFEGTHTNRGSLGPQVLVRHPSLARRRPPVQDEPVASGLQARILSQQGLDPARYRHRPLERRLGACLRALGVSSEVAAWERVESDRAAQAVALNTLLIGVSSFFRDAAVFEVIRTTVVDALKRLGRPPRVWSVGCSTGTELYSVAMILEREGLLDGAELLGTDCRADAIWSAREGVFERDHVANLDGRTRDRYFERTCATWRIASSLPQSHEVASRGCHACEAAGDMGPRALQEPCDLPARTGGTDAPAGHRFRAGARRIPGRGKGRTASRLSRPPGRGDLYVSEQCHCLSRSVSSVSRREPYPSRCRWHLSRSGARFASTSSRRWRSR